MGQNYIHSEINAGERRLWMGWQFEPVWHCISLYSPKYAMTFSRQRLECLLLLQCWLDSWESTADDSPTSHSCVASSETSSFTSDLLVGTLWSCHERISLEKLHEVTQARILRWEYSLTQQMREVGRSPRKHIMSLNWYRMTIRFNETC